VLEDCSDSKGKPVIEISDVLKKSAIMDKYIGLEVAKVTTPGSLLQQKRAQIEFAFKDSLN
jgi:hypothetical protein